MNKLALFSLAASIAVPAAAGAQTVAPPTPWQDVPPAPLNVPGTPPPAAPAPPAAGVTWQRAVRAPMPVPVPPPAAEVRVAPTPAPPPAVMRPGRDRVVVRHGAEAMPRGEVRVVQSGRVGPGFMMPPFWMGPQFMIRDWRVYGLAPPASGQRWLRYYDDALLVDPHGRVLDGRYGLDWDEYDEPWGYDPRGIPVYVGDGDFYPGPEDYAYVEDYDDAYGAPYAGPAPYPPCGGGYAPQACGYGYYPYGYGYGWGGVIVTETTVTTSGCCAGKTVVERRERKLRRYHRPPPPGERG